MLTKKRCFLNSLNHLFEMWYQGSEIFSSYHNVSGILNTGIGRVEGDAHAAGGEHGEIKTAVANCGTGFWGYTGFGEEILDVFVFVFELYIEDTVAGESAGFVVFDAIGIEIVDIEAVCDAFSEDIEPGADDGGLYLIFLQELK